MAVTNGTNGTNGASHANGTNGHTNGAHSLDFSTFYNIINGKQSKTAKTRHGINPSTLEENAEVPVSTQEDVDRAVEAAQAAFPAWSEVPFEERQQKVIQFAEALEAKKDDFAKLLVKEQGKPIGFAYHEIASASGALKALASLKLPEEVVDENDDRVVIQRYTPIGVAVGIVPWNFPIILACSKIVGGLVTGNTMIIKPSPFTPYCGLKLVELAQGIFPPGVLQVLSGGDDLGPMLTVHPGVHKVSFTGSTATGKKVMESCSKTLKRVTLELGGNDPAIVFPSVDIKAVAPKIATLAFMNSGQICLALKRIYVHSSIYNEFLAAMVEHTKSLLVGDGFKEGVFLGPIQNSMQYERVKGFIEEVESKGLKVAVGGSTKEPAGKGYFINPTIIDNPSDDDRLVVEEPFGPIVPLLQWTDEADVIRRANNTEYGLGASVWTQDLEQANRVAKKLQAGTVWVNTHLEVSPQATMGGFKHSGIGSEYGVIGLKAYCNVQTLFLKKR